jgi:DNA-binding response OmpR family regulator
MARVLVVDDERGFRTYLRRFLEAEGHEVRTAADPAGALGAVEDFTPDLLIADWMLRSEQDGLTLATRLRSRFARLAVILITGHPSDALHGSVRVGEVAAVLEKPFGASSLREVVERTLGAAVDARPRTR